MQEGGEVEYMTQSVLHPDDGLILAHSVSCYCFASVEPGDPAHSGQYCI